jgi:hypothetical protein
VAVPKELVRLVDKSVDPLSKRWVEVVRTHEGTPTFHGYNEDALYDVALEIYRHLGKWLNEEMRKEEIKQYYMKFGDQKRQEGFALCELIQAFIINRRVLWFKIESEGLLDTASNLRQALDLSNYIIVFFDRAMFYTSQGYENGRLGRNDQSRTTLLS